MTEPTNPPAAWQPPDAPELRPFHTAIEGQPTAGGEWDWANTVTVETVTSYLSVQDGPGADEPGEAIYADTAVVRQLVRVDTNYKPSRPGDHPVELTRADAAALVAAVLTAIEDTFHQIRVGGLRPAEAAELLRRLEDVDTALVELRSHALDHLLAGTGLDPDFPPHQHPDNDHTSHDDDAERG
jgi:hypothetical protein